MRFCMWCGKVWKGKKEFEFVKEKKKMVKNKKEFVKEDGKIDCMASRMSFLVLQAKLER
jgi:hypothetical protein